MGDLTEKYDLVLARAETVVRGAGEILKAYHDQPDEIDWKGVDDPVTAADRAVNQYLVSEMQKAFPDDAILSEESRDDPARMQCERVWCIDPLDGTKEFIARNGEFSIMVGLAVRGTAVLGVVYQPIVDVLYKGLRCGASSVVDRGKASLLRVSPTGGPESLRLVVSRSHRNPITDRIKAALGIVQERVSGSVGIKCGLIAGGQADLYLHPAPGTKEWDTCAPEAILTGAGGRMTDCWGRDLTYNQADVRRRFGLVASNGACHEMVVRRMIPALAEAGVSPDVGW